MTISITHSLYRNENRGSSRLRKLSKITASKWKNCDSDPGSPVLKFMLLITLLQKLSLKMDFSNTDTFSHPISYYPGASVFTENNVTRWEKQHWAGKNNIWSPEENNKLVIIKPVSCQAFSHISSILLCLLVCPVNPLFTLLYLVPQTSVLEWAATWVPCPLASVGFGE